MRGLRSNPVTTLVAMGTIAVSLLLFGSFALLLQNMQSLLDRLGDELYVTAFFEQGLPSAKQRELAVLAATVEGVEGVRIVSETEALERFRDGVGSGAALLEGLSEIDGIHLLGPRELEQRCSVFSIVHETIESAALATTLERDHGILARAGLHCAPFAHQTFGTDPGTAAAHGRDPGACRLSLGPFLQHEDIDAALGALRSLAPARNRKHEGAVHA